MRLYIETNRTGADHSIPGTMNDASFVEKHCDVSEEGWITIPHGKLPNAWQKSPDIQSFHSWDRSFVFPGEQVHILACLSVCEQDGEVVTPFKFAAVMSKNNMKHGTKRDNAVENGEASYDGENSPQMDNSDGESLLRTEDQKKKTKRVLQRFKNSHFFVRFADSGESRGIGGQLPSNPSREDAQNLATMSNSTDKHLIGKNGMMDQGNFDANATGGIARNCINCFSLTSGDIVVVLQVNIGDDFLQDPFIEIRQFERRSVESFSDQQADNLLNACNEPCGELLTWLFPLDNTFPASRSPSPLPLSSSGIGRTSQRSNISSSPGSQIFSFGNFRSYSMSTLPQSTARATAPVTTPSSKSNYDLEDRDRYSGKKLSKGQIAGKEGPLSFRGVLLEPERFSVCCGLEGVYIPGRRWRRKLKVIQPIEIHSSPAVCSTDDLICVQIKNVSPVHIPEIVVYIDAITIVLGETARSLPLLSLPIASIEVGDDLTLPNLPLRRGEEHSFILKPAISSWKKYIPHDKIGAHSSHAATSNALKWSSLLKLTDGKENGSNTDHYSIVVSCRCNASESRLFFKQPINWKPRMSSDIIISVACKMSKESNGSNSLVSQLPVQILTLKASNLTSEDLTMTILAPDSFTSPPSVLSLNSSRTSPASPSLGISNASGVSRNQASPVSDAIPSAGFCCSHLWLQSKVPLGCVPSQSTATIKLELLPLTDGIITLETLQIDVKERGVTYIPEHSLKIIATSCISAGVS